MPLYEYKCEKCLKVHEMMQKFSDPLVTECPDCQGPVTKLMSLSAFSLKGSGWYSTDYKKSAAPAAVPACGASAGECAKPSSGAGECSN